ncbi:MAG: hypothetical protein ACLS8R_02785 [Anaeromassilibacillus sp.]
MPKKRKDPPQARPKANGVIEGAGEVVEQRITRTLEENYMPYAMSVILSRAIPEIDGFKPAHRKLLYTMYRWACSATTNRPISWGRRCAIRRRRHLIPWCAEPEYEALPSKGPVVRREEEATSRQQRHTRTPWIS